MPKGQFKAPPPQPRSVPTHQPQKVTNGVQHPEPSDTALIGDTRNRLHAATLRKVGGAHGKTLLEMSDPDRRPFRAFNYDAQAEEGHDSQEYSS